jgi:hypothetical protein
MGLPKPQEHILGRRFFQTMTSDEYELVILLVHADICPSFDAMESPYRIGDQVSPITLAGNLFL